MIKTNSLKAGVIFKGLTDKQQERIIIWVFLFVPVLLLLVFSYYPGLRLLMLSFAEWDGMSPEYNYVGLINYKEVFTDPQIWRALLNNLVYVGASLLQTFLGLFIAIILNGNIRGRNFYKSAIFMPYVLNGVAVAFMFNYLYNFETSPANLLLRTIGLGQYAIHWLSNSYLSNISLALIGVWCYTGLTMVIFLGGLQSISTEQFEAADLDGANFIQKVWFIVIPSIKKIIELNLFLSLNGALQAYFQPFIITKGGPAGATDTFVTLTVKTAFNFSRFGKASAMGVVLMVIIMLVTGIQKLVIRGEEKHE